MKKQKKDHEQWQKIPELSKSGYRLLREKRLEEAEGEFQKILGMDKKNIYALVGMGDSKRSGRKYNEAVDFYQLALSAEPLNKFALIGIADAYRGLNRFNDAIKIWEEYLSYSENEFDIAIITRLADTYRKKKIPKKALTWYDKSFSIDRKNPYVLSGLGLLHFELNDYHTSLSYWHQLLEIEPDDVKVLTNTGNCYRKLREFSHALKYFYKALEVENRNFYALYGIADSYRGLKDYEKATEYWRKILEKDPHNKKILTRVGDSYRNLGNLKTAKFYYKKAIEREFDYYAILGLSILEKKEKNYTAAIENLTQLENLSGLNIQITLLLSECYDEMNERDKAIDILSSALKKGINNENIKNRMKLLIHHK